MNKFPIQENQLLKCDCGIKKSRLRIPDDRPIFSQNGKFATIKDSEAYKNILPFGYCKKISPQDKVEAEVFDPESLKKVKVKLCTPMIEVNWLNAEKEITINGEYALLSTCFVPCLFGGMISIEVIE